MHKTKILCLLAFAFSLIGYLQWGNSNTAFIFQAEYEIFSKLPDGDEAFKHPFILLPLIGQILLIVSIFLKKPRGFLIITALCLIGILFGMLLIVGFFGAGVLTVASSLPFLITSVLLVIHLRKIRRPADHAIE